MTTYTDQQYKEMKKRWKKGINIVGTTTTEDVEDYLNWKYEEYGPVTDENLWQCFQEDFGSFNAEAFNLLSTRKLQDLKTYLLSRGVYVIPNDKKVTIAASLVQCAQEEGQHKWTTEEVLSVHGKRVKFVSEILLDMVSDTPPSTIPGLQQQQPQSQYGTLPGLRPQPQYAALPGPQAPQTTPQAAQTTPVTPQVPPQTPVAPRLNAVPGHGRELANLAKLYTDELKYSGMNESLRQKLTIFFDMCNRADVPQEAYLKAFLTMLKGLALTHFYDTNASQICSTTLPKS